MSTPLPPRSGLCPYLSLKPSRALSAFLLTVHSLSLLAAVSNPLPLWFRLILVCAVLLSLASSLQAKPKFIGLKSQPDGGWILRGADSSETEASLLGASIVNPWFVILRFQTENRSHALLICRDSLDSEGFRRLRVALNIVGFRDGKEADETK